MDTTISTMSSDTPSASTNSRTTPSILTEAPKEQDHAYPLLVLTCMNDRAGPRKIYEDYNGFFALKTEEGFADIVKVKSPSSYTEVAEAINTQIPELADRTILGRNGKLTPVSLDSIMVSWSLPGGGTGFTVLNEGNCGKVLEMLRNQGWKDNLTAMYKCKFV